jgi:hypothetical protein
MMVWDLAVNLHYKLTTVNILMQTMLGDPPIGSIGETRMIAVD